MIGFSQASQNVQELQVAMQLCQVYLQDVITAKDTVILACYRGQIALTKNAVALTPGLEDVDKSTIDAYQGEERSVVILCIVDIIDSIGMLP